MLKAAQFVEVIEQRQGLKIACLEEIAWQNNWINREQLETQMKRMGKSGYSDYLNRLIRHE